MLHFLVQWFVKITAFIPQLFIFKIKVNYEDKSVQGKRIRGKAIVISNHHCLMDFAVNMFVFWRRTLRCAVAEVLYRKNVFLTTFLHLMGTVKVERDAHDFGFIGKMAKVLRRGGVVEIFPESRLPRPGEALPLEFKPSYVYLALESGAPIIPIYSNGKVFARERAEIIIGKPIYVSELYNPALPERENISAINDYVRSKVIELREQLEEKIKIAAG